MSGIDMKKVEIAVRFLSNSKVKGSPTDHKEAFLRTKGLNDAEIAEALKIISEEEFSVPSNTNHWGLFTYLKGLVLGASVLSAANYAYKAYILPYVAHEIKDDGRIENLGESVETLKDDIKQHTYELSSTLKRILTILEEQQKSFEGLQINMKPGGCEAENATLSKIESELSNVKSMMLNRKQFPAVPFHFSSADGVAEIPAWQRVTNQQSDAESDEVRKADVPSADISLADLKSTNVESQKQL